MDIRNITILEARSIRHEVLKPGRPESEVAYPGDESELAEHLGAFEGDKLLGFALPHTGPHYLFTLRRADRAGKTGAPRHPELRERSFASRRLRLRKNKDFAGGDRPGADREGADEMKTHVALGRESRLKLSRGHRARNRDDMVGDDAGRGRLLEFFPLSESGHCQEGKQEDRAKGDQDLGSLAGHAAAPFGGKGFDLSKNARSARERSLRALEGGFPTSAARWVTALSREAP